MHLMSFTNAAPLAVAIVGLTLGMRHATDADHVIAVTTIVSRERRLAAAARIGIAWGLGHSATVLLVGSAIILFKITIAPRLGLAMEFAVAVVLVLLGLSNLMRPRSMPEGPGESDGEPLPVVHSHAHFHGAVAHSHPHAHLEPQEHEHHQLPEPATETSNVRGLTGLVRAFGVGLVHGLAGSAAIALLVLSTIPKPWWAILYLAVFSLGTVVGMLIITTAIGIPFALSASRLVRFNDRLRTSSALLSIGFGLFLAYRIGFVAGLFSASPIWTAH
jgi:high-affinity nickel-transport protein